MHRRLPLLAIAVLLASASCLLGFAQSAASAAAGPRSVSPPAGVQQVDDQHSGNDRPPASAADLDRLIEGKRYRELEVRLPGAQIPAVERAYFEAILDDRRNRVTQCIAALHKTIPSLRKTQPRRAAVALSALAVDNFKIGSYAEAVSVSLDLLKHFSTQLKAAEKSSIEDNLHTFALLGDAPPQTVSGMRNFTVTLQRDAIGDLDVPLQIGLTQEHWIFDTGANISTIPRSTAKRLGLSISKGRACTQAGATGAEVPLSTTIIPEIHFGDAIIHDVVALVIEDKDLDIHLGPEKHYQIQGILGFPVLAALGSFTVTGMQMVVSPESLPSNRSTSLYVDELTPLIAASVDGRELLFGFDTGSSSAELTAQFYRQFRSQFASLQTSKTTFGGGGGSREMAVYRLPKIELGLGAAKATLANVPVLTEDRGLDPLDHLFGNLGQGLLQQFRSYTIDFTSMRLSVGDNIE